SLASTWLRTLVVTTEEKADANHRIDNDLAIALLALICRSSTVFDWAIESLKKRNISWVNSGTYPERTPCYQRLIAARIVVLRNLIEASGWKSEEILDDLHRVLNHTPNVHVNDSYLPRQSWQSKPAEIECSLAVSRFLGPNYIVTVIKSPVPERGYRAHVHDATGSLFVHTISGYQLIGGLGTPTYGSSTMRNLARSAHSYCTPRPTQNFAPRLVPFRSFRHTNIRPLKISEKIDEMRNQILWSDRVSDNFEACWTLKKSTIELWVSRASHLTFWTDFDQNYFFDLVSFEGEDLDHTVDQDLRYDGIGNAKQAWKHNLKLSRNLIIKLGVS
ncbi:MAG: hypothetical protein AAGD96_22965, partial [Chloroflexota bacterium]